MAVWVVMGLSHEVVTGQYILVLPEVVQTSQSGGDLVQALSTGPTRVS